MPIGDDQGSCPARRHP